VQHGWNRSDECRGEGTEGQIDPHFRACAVQAGPEKKRKQQTGRCNYFGTTTSNPPQIRLKETQATYNVAVAQPRSREPTASAEQRTLRGAAFCLKGWYLCGHDGSTGVASCVVPTNQSDSATNQKWCAHKREKVRLCARVAVVCMNLRKQRREKQSWNGIKRRKLGNCRRLGV
jgi:hypothetical protein